MGRIKPGKLSIDIECRTAQEFLHVLDPSSGCFHGEDTIFRGVSSTKHKLLPSAHRPDAVLATSRKFRVGPAHTAHEQAHAELGTVRRFFDIAARQGIRLPEDSYTLRASLDEWKIRLTLSKKFEPYEWPPKDFYSLIGLAQHYRVPTRALDWTWSAYVAAYFAARSADTSEKDSLVVWAFDDYAWEVDRVFFPSTIPRQLVVYSASGADNENLRAQRGVFMLCAERVNTRARVFSPRTYNRLLFKSIPSLEPAVMMTRVLVPVSEARRVLAILATKGITGATLYPGLWGVAREYEEQHMLEGISGQVLPPTAISRLRTRYYRAVASS